MAFIEASKTGSVIDIDAEHITYDNTESGLESENVQGAIDKVVDNIGTINDNLSGFKFYPTGTQLVALVADDSFYKDANGKYVLADSPTGRTLLEDTATYKALASIEDTRGEVGADSALPFSGDKDWTLIIKVKGWYSTNMNGGDVTQNMKIQHINGVTSITEYASGRGPDRYSGTNTQNVWGGYNCEFVSFDYDD